MTWAANEISTLVLFPHMVRDVALGDGEVQLVKISIPPRIAGRTVARPHDARARSLPFAIVRAGRSFIPSSHEQLHDGDIVEVAVLTSAMDKFQQMTTP